MRLAFTALLVVVGSIGSVACQSHRFNGAHSHSAADQRTEVVPLRYAHAGQTAAVVGNALQHPSLRVVADERTNSLILVGPPEAIVRAQDLIVRLDIEVK